MNRMNKMEQHMTLFFVSIVLSVISASLLSAEELNSVECGINLTGGIAESEHVASLSAFYPDVDSAAVAACPASLWPPVLLHRVRATIQLVKRWRQRDEEPITSQERNEFLMDMAFPRSKRLIQRVYGERTAESAGSDPEILNYAD